MNVIISVEIPMKLLLDLMVAARDARAMAGWGTIMLSELPPDFDPNHLPWMEGEEKWNASHDYFAPLVEGGAWFISDHGTEDQIATYRLDLRKIKNGLQLMSLQFPELFGELLAEKGDSRHANVLINLALFDDDRYC